MYFFVLFYVFLCSLYCLFCDVSCIVCVYMCTEQLPSGGYPVAVKYISYILSHRSVHTTTCFGPVYLPSSGCIINLINSYTIMRVCYSGGNEISSDSSGGHGHATHNCQARSRFPQNNPRAYCIAIYEVYNIT
jgi:hypothetical protein